MTAPQVVERAYSEHLPKWQRFQSNLTIPSSQVGGDKNAAPNVYQRQYSHVYHQRLAALGPLCWNRIRNNNINTQQHVSRILELKENVPSVVVGTLVCEQSHDETPVHPDSHCRPSDALFLEDESGRVELGHHNNDNLKHAYCTGVVLGVSGTVGRDGVLQVDQVYLPQWSNDSVMMDVDNDNHNTTEQPQQESAPHLLLVSGLRCGSTDSLRRELLTLFLQGRFGVDAAARVSRVIVAGGLLHSNTTTDNNTNKNASNNTTQALRDLDGCLLQWAAAGVPVDVLPGQSDPTTANWPQRPLHSALLPRSSAPPCWIRQTPNPYAARHARNTAVVGTDGRNVADLVQHVLVRDDNNDESAPQSLRPPTHLEALARTLAWCHLCPTGPNTVPTVPHADADPMCLLERPAVYFCGNAPEFATQMTAGGTRLICVPDFDRTGQAVLVHLETRDVQVLQFEV